MSKSSYVLAITIGFAIGIFLQSFGEHNLIIWYWLIGATLSITIWFWQTDLIRILGLALCSALLAYVYPTALGRDQLLALPNNSPIIAWFESLRFNYVLALQQVLPEPESSLAAGLVIGTSGGFPYVLKQQFINTGTIHLVAVSGFNITIVLRLFSGWLKPFGRWPAFIVGTLALVAFIIMVGGQASVVRAGIMGWLFLLAQVSFRQFNIRNALFIAGFFMILLSPKILVEDIGFQLSFLAMLGLIYISPFIALVIDRTSWLKILPEWLTGVLQETLAAQIAVAFIILGHFGRLSLIAPIPNILIVPMIFIPMFLTIGIGLVALIFHSSIAVLTIPLVWILRYILGVIALFNLVPYGSLNLGNWDWWLVLGLYIVLILGLFFGYKYLPKKRLNKISHA